MRGMLVLLVASLLALAFAAPAVADPVYIYSMHDAGGESHMADKGTKGWIVFTQAIGSNPGDYGGMDYTSWSNAGYGVIVRLNNGYDGAGNLPYQSQYDNFAQRCKNYVAASPGVSYWIIGNETNLPREWPGNVGGDPNTGEPITSARYVSCYIKCWNKIKELGSTIKVCPSPSGTWAPPYSAQGIEGFMDYWVNCLNGVGASRIDGLIIHTYTHGCDPALITSNQTMGPPYEGIYYHFKVYRNYMARIPSTMTTKPVFITESDQNVECASGGYTWLNSNNGWVRAAYAEINNWNASNSQKIRCLTLFRWPNVWEGQWNFSISTRQGVIDDWRQAMDSRYVWTTTVQQNDANSGGDAGNTSSTALAISPGSYSGYVDSGDTNDYYKFSVTSGQTITCSMTPPAGSDFDLYLYNASGTLKRSSLTRSAGAAESVTFTADSTGDWRLRVYRYSGGGTYSFGVGLTSGGMTTNPPTGSNVALSAASWQTDSNYSASYDGSKAKDGVVSAGSKWTSTGSSSTHWLSYDLGATKSVTGFVVRHASAGGEATYYNTQQFKIQSASSMSGPWVDECSVDNTAQAGVTNRSYTTPKALRYVRLYITDAGVDNYARIPEFEVYATTTSELVSNGGFEGGFTNGVPNGWSTWQCSWSNGITYMDEVNTKYSGAHSARWGRDDNLRFHGGLCQAVSTSAGVTYDLSAWMRFVTSDPGTWMEVGYDLTGQTSNGEAGTINYTKLEGGGQNTWIPYTSSFTATGSTVSIFIKYGHYDEVGGGFIWVVADDVSMRAR